jgi:hypothetical protein
VKPLWRVCRLVVAVSLHFDDELVMDLDAHPYQSERSDPDPTSKEKVGSGS